MNRDTESVLSSLINDARKLCELKTPALARPLLAEAWTLATEANLDAQAIEVAQIMSEIESPKLRKDWTLRALALAENSQDENAKNSLSALYTTMAWHSMDLHQYDRSIELFKKALTRLENELAGASDDVELIKRTMLAKWSLAKALRVKGRAEEAMQIQQELLSQLQASNSNSADVCEEIGECLRLLKRTNEAAAYFENAHDELSKDKSAADSMPDRLRRLKSLGKSAKL